MSSQKLPHLRVLMFFRDLFTVSRQELKAIFRDPGVRIFFLIVPLFYPLLYALIYNKEVVTDAPLVVVDENQSAISREYIRKVDATPETSVVAIVHTQSEAKNIIDRGEAYGCLIIPKDFSKKIARSEQTTITLISDLASIFYYKSFMLSSNEVALEMGKDIRAKRETKYSREETAIDVRPVQNNFIALYNPNSGYATFLLPSILIILLQQTMLLGVCMLVGTARERKKQAYISPHVAYRRGLPLRVVIGRSLAYVSIYLVSSIWTLVVVPYFFRLPMLADPWELFSFLLPYILSITFFAQSVAVFVRGREDTMIYLVFTSVIFMFLLGVVWPKQALPPFWRMLSQLLPCTPAAEGYIKLMSFGANLQEVASHYKLLWVQSFVYLLVAGFGHRYLIRITRNQSQDRLTYPAN